MRNGFLLTYLGSGAGPLIRLSPHARLLIGILVAIASMVTPSNQKGFVFSPALAIVMILLSGMRYKHLLGIVPVSLLMFAPLLVATMLSSIGTHDNSAQSSVPAGSAFTLPLLNVVAKGLSCTLIVTAVLSTVTFSELTHAITVAPLPLTIRLIVIQILQQTSLLVGETRTIAQALALRGVSSGFSTTALLLGNFSTTWMLRIVGKSHRVSLCMAMRGYAEVLPVFEQTRFGSGDKLAIGCTLLMTLVLITYCIVG